MRRVDTEDTSIAKGRNESVPGESLRYEQMLEHNRVIMWETSKEGVYTYAGWAVRSVLGYEPDELVGKKHFYDLHPAEGREEFRNHALKIMANREPFRGLRNPIETKDGRVLWVSTNGFPLFNSDGSLRGYQGSDIDVTERHQAEEALKRAHEELEHRVIERTEALKQSEERYRRMVRATGCFLFSVETFDGRKTYTIHEAGAEEVTGYTASDYERDPSLWERIIHPEDLHAVLRHVNAVINGEPISVIEHRILHKDGTVRWVKSTLAVRTNDDGKRNGYDGLISDITARKEAEEECEKVMDSLHQVARCDSMTGLFNRRGFKEEMDRIWNLSSRHPFPIGLLIVDIDHFKSINDTYGHVAGDAVIKEYSALVKSALRDTDTISRYAGDELVVILPWADLPETRRIGERILEMVRSHEFCPGENSMKITVSIGAHACTPRPGRSAERLIINTDRALYRAKQSGRDRLCFAEKSANEKQTGLPAELSTRSPGHGRVLVVDDDPMIHAYLKQALQQEYMHVTSVYTTAEALEAAEHEKGMIDVALIDLVLGNDSGLDLVNGLSEIDKMLVPVVITGQATMDTAIESMRRGAYDFIQKPVHTAQLHVTLRRAMGHRRLLMENHRYQTHLEAMVWHRGQSLTRALEQEKKSYQYTLETLAAAIEAREQHTAEHSRRVAQMAVILASKIGATSEELVQIRSGALLHDIGKIGVPDSILLKPGPLTEEEWIIMQAHPQIGHQILASSPALKEAAEIVLSHHEKFDGSGYPRGLKGMDICMGARIFAVVDAYDVMRSPRPYAPAMSAEETLEEILKHHNTQFDPYVVDALIHCQSAIEAEGKWNAG